MTTSKLNDQWARFLADDLPAADESRLLTALRVDAQFRQAALRDAELNGLLRAVGHQQQSGAEEQFVASVLQRIATDPLDARPATADACAASGSSPPSIDQTTFDDLPIAEAIDGSSPPIIKVVPHLADAVGGSTVRRRNYTPQIVAAIIAAVAATLLIAFVAVNRDLDPGLADDDPSQPTDAVSDQLGTGRPSLAESRTPSVQTPRDQMPRDQAPRDQAPGERTPDALPDQKFPDRRNELVPAQLPGALVESSQAPMVPNGTGPFPNQPPTFPNQPPTTQSTAFAVLVDSSDDANWYELPQEIAGQSLSLQTGSAVFRLAGGTTVSITGPAHFQIDSVNSLILASGFASADVPPRAIGFAIDTPTARIIDLGTQFDARETPNKGLSVRVLKGRVAVQPVAGKSKRTTMVAGEQMFIDTDGAILDWKVEIQADVFGDIVAYVDGQVFDIHSVREYEAFENDLFDRDTDGWRRQAVTNKARYIFNGRLEESHDVASGAALMKTVFNDLSGLQWIIRDANAEQGEYRVKDRIYKYTNLKEKLQVRRDIARIHGSRALAATRFFENQKVRTTSDDGLKLYELQRDLIKRLDLGRVEPLPNLGPPNGVRVEINQNGASITFGDNDVEPPTVPRGKEPVVIEPKSSDATKTLDAEDARQRRAQREAAFKQLQEIRGRKASQPTATPISP